MINHPNRSKKTITLRELIAETYTDNETKFFGFGDRGNGCAWGERGTVMTYDDDADGRYGNVEMVACEPIIADDGSATEFVYKSRWIDGQNGYQFRVMF